jgi:hypothetical protein
MKPYRFLYEWKQTHGAFVKPKLKWYFGPWWREGNLPVWRRGNTIHFGKYSERKDNYNFAKLEKSEWNELGKKNHPILSKLVRPSYELPRWLSFYFFNSDIVYKTKWSEDDFRYEFPAHITLVIFGFAISVTAYIPKSEENDFTCQDDYWESLLTYNYFKGDIKKTNDVMGYWNSPKDENFRFRFQPRFLSSAVDRDDLIALQAEQLPKLKEEAEKEEAERKANKVYAIYADVSIIGDRNVHDGWYVCTYEKQPLIYKEENDAMNALKNLHSIEITKNGLKKHIDYKCWIGDKNSSFLNNKMTLYKKSIKNKDIDILDKIICI